METKTEKKNNNQKTKKKTKKPHKQDTKLSNLEPPKQHNNQIHPTLFCHESILLILFDGTRRLHLFI